MNRSKTERRFKVVFQVRSCTFPSRWNVASRVFMAKTATDAEIRLYKELPRCRFIRVEALER